MPFGAIPTPMKKVSLNFLLLGLLLGVFIGHQLGRGSLQRNSGSADGNHLSTVSSASHRNQAEPSSRIANRQVTTPSPDSVIGRENWLRDQIQNQIRIIRKHSELKVKALQIRIGLDADQLKLFEQFLNERIEQYHTDLLSKDLESSLGWSVEMLTLVDDLADQILHEDQKEEFKHLKDFERRANIESEAYRELAALTSLGLNEEQKQLAFEVLVEKESREFSDSPQIPASFGIYEDQVIETRKNWSPLSGDWTIFSIPNNLSSTGCSLNGSWGYPTSFHYPM